MFTLEDALASRYVTIIGYFYICRLVIYFLYNSWSGFRTFIWSRIRSNIDLKSTYGQWAVVTGCTDGIGKEFAKQMAERGMNVFLISRDEYKLKITAAEILAVHDVDVKWHRADFTDVKVYDAIRTELDDLDVGILVNNVGFSNKDREEIANQSEDFFKNIINTNILSYVMMTSIVLPKMKTKMKGLIINMGSLSGISPLPYLGMYSCTKGFIDYFSMCLSMELSGSNIKIKCFRGGTIDTKLFADMTSLHKFMRSYTFYTFPTVETYVTSAMRTLNTEVEFTAGYWGHALYQFLTETFFGRAGLSETGKILMSSNFIWGKMK